MEFHKWTHVLVQCKNKNKVFRTTSNAGRLGYCDAEPKYKHFALYNEVSILAGNSEGQCPEGSQHVLNLGMTLYYEVPETTGVYVPCTLLEVFYQPEKRIDAVIKEMQHKLPIRYKIEEKAVKTMLDNGILTSKIADCAVEQDMNKLGEEEYKRWILMSNPMRYMPGYRSR